VERTGCRALQLLVSPLPLTCQSSRGTMYILSMATCMVTHGYTWSHMVLSGEDVSRGRTWWQSHVVVVARGHTWWQSHVVAVTRGGSHTWWQSHVVTRGGGRTWSHMVRVGEDELVCAEWGRAEHPLCKVESRA